MVKLITNRLGQMVFSLLCMLTIIFFVVRLTGDPVTAMIGEESTPEQIALLREHLGLDKPLYSQYFLYLSRVFTGDFGVSLRAHRPALEVVLERFPATFELGLTSILASIVISIPIGVYCAYKKGNLIDALGRGFAILGQSTPSFWLGIVLIWIFAVWLGVVPAGGRGSVEQLILPAVTLGWYTAAGITRLTRSSMLEVLRADYVLLARAKGIPERMVVWKHAFKNSLIPVVTFSAILFAHMLAGTVVVEVVFSWPGVGRLLINSVGWRDFAVVQTAIVLISALYLVANLMVDIMYVYINPRIKYGSK